MLKHKYENFRFYITTYTHTHTLCQRHFRINKCFWMMLHLIDGTHLCTYIHTEACNTHQKAEKREAKSIVNRDRQKEEEHEIQLQMSCRMSAHAGKKWFQKCNMKVSQFSFHWQSSSSFQIKWMVVPNIHHCHRLYHIQIREMQKTTTIQPTFIRVTRLGQA